MPGTRLVVVGDGPSPPWLERQLPHAKFSGLLRGRDLAHAFASLDVFVHTGEAETFCQTVQEAQASGVAAIAPAAGGPLDLIDRGRTGLLYDPADASSLHDTVARLVADVELRRTLATAGLAAVQDRSWAAVVDELIDVYYAAVLDPARPAPAARMPARDSLDSDYAPQHRSPPMNTTSLRHLVYTLATAAGLITAAAGSVNHCEPLLLSAASALLGRLRASCHRGLRDMPTHSGFTQNAMLRGAANGGDGREMHVPPIGSQHAFTATARGRVGACPRRSTGVVPV